MKDDAPNQRSFGLNSDEAYEAMCPSERAAAQALTPSPVARSA
jgi:hypothetical protein